MRPSPPPPTKPAIDRLARQRIQQCLDNDEETIDLSGCGLASLKDETIKPLHHMTRRPKHHFPGGAEAYQKLAPTLKIFLSTNHLQTIPSELFKLQNLHVLSVRNNGLVQLPQSMSRLRNLVELNVATNQLRYLPYELIGLINESDRLLNLHLRPNPFVEPLSHMGESISPAEHTPVLSEYVHSDPREDFQRTLGPWPKSSPPRVILTDDFRFRTCTVAIQTHYNRSHSWACATGGPPSTGELADVLS